MKYSELEEEAQRKLDEIGLKYDNEFLQNEILRRDKETEWVQDLRQSKGIYDPEVIIKIPKSASRVYPKYTRGKETTLRGKLNNFLLPDNDKNWTIEPTPKPKLSKKALDETVDMLRTVKIQKLSGQEGITEEDTKVTKEELEEAIKEYAIARCKKMEIEMADQLVEINYDGIMREAIKSAVRFGTGIVKGALSKKVSEVNYEEDSNSFKQVESMKHLPDIEFIRVWDWYPDMSATELEGCDFVWERYIMNKYQLRQLAKRDDFLSDVIEDYIKEHPNGKATYKQWEIDIETIDKNSIKDTTRPGKYEVFFRVGLIDTETLRKIGVGGIREDEESVELMANMWLLGKKVIKYGLNPVAGNIMPYHIFYFDKDESSILATGLVRIIRDTQLTIGGAMRATLNNAAIVSGVQVEVNTELLEYDEDPDDVRPNRVWKRRGAGAAANAPAVRPIDFQSHIADLLTILDKAMMLGDLEISIPMWMQSNMEKGEKESLGRLSAKLSSSTVTVKDIAKAFDTCNESLIKALYAWNMEFNPNDDIKGDFAIRAKGSYSLIMQELRFQAVTYFTQTLNDEERLYIKTGKFLREKAKMIDLDPDEFIRTDEEVEELKASMRDAEAEAMVKADKMADIRKKEAMAKNLETKADVTAKGSDLETIKALTE